MTGTLLASLQPSLEANQRASCGWQFAATGYSTSSTLPVYLSFDIGPGITWDNLEIWQYDGSAWGEYAANDLSYDGTYASFTATSLSGYAVVAPVPEPGTIVLLVAGLLGVLGLHAVEAALAAR